MGEPDFSAAGPALCLTGANLRQVGLRLDLPNRRVSLRESLASACPALARQLVPFLAARFAVCVDLSAAARGPDGLRAVSDVLVATLPEALRACGQRPARLAFSCPSTAATVEAVMELRHCAALGWPAVFLRMADAQMAAGRARTDREHADSKRWHRQTALAFADPGISIILEATTRPACDFSTPEKPETVLPVSRFETAAATAWLTLQLDLSRIMAAEGGLQLRPARRLLRAGLRAADNRVDRCDWASASLRADALLHRRLAIQVTGIGDLVDRCGWRPSEFATIYAVSRRLRLLRRMLIRESVSLARRRGPFPALLQGTFRETLGRRFGEHIADDLIYRRALRHRHLLVISPWAMFPRERPAYPASEYLHLLPALRAADTVAMYRPDMLSAPGLDDFRSMLGRAWVEARNR